MNKIEIHQHDAIEFMETMPDESVDVLITDPPYWTLDRWRNVGTTTRLGGNRNKENQRDEMWFPTIDQDYLWRWFLEADRLLKIDGHMYVFADDRVAPILMHWIREAQDEHRFGDCHALIWDKVTNGMGYHYRRRYEMIVFAWREAREGIGSKQKCQRKLHDLGKPDVFRYPRVTGRYPTQKPAPLVTELVTQSARVGDTLFDPFAGSGVLGEATPFDYQSKIILNDIGDLSHKWMRENLIDKANFLGQSVNTESVSA